MTIFNDSYQTTNGSVLITKPIEVAIKEAFIKDGLNTVQLNVKENNGVIPVFITGSYASENEIPLFTHPISILNYQHKDYICTDLRFFVRKDTPLDRIESGVKNLTEYNFAKSRAIMNLIWMAGGRHTDAANRQGVSQIKNGLPFAGIVFAAWLSETIAKAYALDFKDQTQLFILSSFYYQTLFTDETTIDQEAKERMATHTIKATKAPAEFVFSVFDKIGPIKDINDYCANVANVLENVRLKNFNLVMLLTIVKNSWYGNNAKEFIQVAIEHPPTWVAIVYTALSERTYKSSMIYRVAERYGKRGGSDEFMKNYVQMAHELLTKPGDDTVVYRKFD